MKHHTFTLLQLAMVVEIKFFFIDLTTEFTDQSNPTCVSFLLGSLSCLDGTGNRFKTHNNPQDFIEFSKLSKGALKSSRSQSLRKREAGF